MPIASSQKCIFLILQWIRESNFNQQISCKLQSKYNIMQNKERSSLCVISVFVYFSEACGMFVAWSLSSNFWSTIYKYGVEAHSQNPKPQYYPNSSPSQIQMLKTVAKTKIISFSTLKLLHSTLKKISL